MKIRRLRDYSKLLKCLISTAQRVYKNIFKKSLYIIKQIFIFSCFYVLTLTQYTGTGLRHRADIHSFQALEQIQSIEMF